MATIITELKQSFHEGNIVTRIIYINIGVYLVATVLNVANMLFNHSIDNIISLFMVPSSLQVLASRPWSLLTYMYLHVGFMHILFNMLWLYWFGEIFLRFFTSKHLRGLYIFSGLCGAVCFVVSYNLFPYFSDVVAYSSLLGASAAVLGLVSAVAYREPNYQVRLIFFGNVSLKWLALITIAIDLCLALDNNSGGHLAHIGGALGGLLFAYMLDKGYDLTHWINAVIDWLESLFEKKPRKPKMKVTRGGGFSSHQADYDFNARKKAKSDEIDHILDKIKVSGYEALTSEEKKTLFDASKNK